jgi:hypothetical protein
MEFKKEIIVNKPINEVWNVLGNQYTEAYKWAGGLYHSEGKGAPQLEGASCNNRSCHTSFGRLVEEINTFDTQNYVLEYEVKEGFPSFMGKAVNNWSLTPVGNKTQVNMHLVMETKGILGTIMQPMMKMQMGNTLKNILGDFKHYVETGEPSPNKAKEMAKYQAKLARA